MNILGIRECKNWYPLKDGQGDSLIDAFLERVQSDDIMIQEVLNVLASDNHDSYKVFEIQDILEHRKKVSVQKGRFEWVG